MLDFYGSKNTIKSTMGKQESIDKKKLLRSEDHLTRPPRLEGKVKNAMMYSPKKKKKPHDF